MILITGSSGLVGRHLREVLTARGHEIRLFDLARTASEDVRHPDAVGRALEGVTGIVHLAAVSRVVDGERAPEKCWDINENGLKTVLRAATQSPLKPWFVFVSSREIYGNAGAEPVREDYRYGPLNTYARTKVAGEQAVLAARESGLTANICRLSTVYGSTDDHRTRVLPAFCRAAAEGGVLHVEGAGVTLDPVHISDVALGLAALAELTAREGIAPPIHFVSGQGQSLLGLATLAMRFGRRSSRIVHEPARTFDVSQFVGNPSRAKMLLGWQPQVSIEQGVEHFVHLWSETLAQPRYA